MVPPNHFTGIDYTIDPKPPPKKRKCALTVIQMTVPPLIFDMPFWLERLDVSVGPELKPKDPLPRLRAEALTTSWSRAASDF